MTWLPNAGVSYRRQCRQLYVNNPLYVRSEYFKISPTGYSRSYRGKSCQVVCIVVVPVASLYNE